MSFSRLLALFFLFALAFLFGGRSVFFFFLETSFSFCGDFHFLAIFAGGSISFLFGRVFFYFSLVNYSRSWGVIFLFGEVLLLSEVLCS